MVAKSLASVFLLLASLTAAATEQRPHDNVVSDHAYAHAQHRVKIDHGRRLNIYCIGKGSPAVILDSGLADMTMVWGLVQPVVARSTRTCSYDRAGIGFSDPSNRPGTSANIAEDLHQLLRAELVEPPYVIVGHSSGGMNVRLYADMYPNDIAGMVLVDPSHEDQSTRIWKFAPPGTKKKWEQNLNERRACVRAADSGFAEGPDHAKDAGLYKLCVRETDPAFDETLNYVALEIHLTPRFQHASLSEQENIFSDSSDQVRGAAHSYGDLPLIVLTRSAMPYRERPGDTPDLWEARTQQWGQLHDELAALSTRGVNRVIENSSHYIQLSQPQAVTAAILEVLTQAKIVGH